MGPHCLPVCKNRIEKCARIFSRRHKQTTFSDAGFLGALRVKSKILLLDYFFYTYTRNLPYHLLISQIREDILKD